MVPICTLIGKTSRNQTALWFFPLSVSVTQLVVCLLMVGGRDLARVHNSYDSCFVVCQLFTEASLMTFLCVVFFL